MQDKFEFTDESLFRLHQKISTLMESIRENDTPIDKSDLLDELASIDLNSLEIRSVFCDDYCEDDNMKEIIMNDIQSQKGAIQGKAVKTI